MKSYIDQLKTVDSLSAIARIIKRAAYDRTINNTEYDAIYAAANAYAVWNYWKDMYEARKFNLISFI